MFSRRSAGNPEESDFERAIRAARQSGAGFIDLTCSNPTIVGLPYDASALLAALSSPDTIRYDPAPLGLESARRAVAAELDSALHVTAKDVVLTASTSESYSFLFKLLTDPGDEVLVPCPGYPLFEHLAAFEGVTLVHYPLRYDGAWHVDLDALRALVTGRTRAIVVVSPNNPTGNFLRRDELRALEALGLPIISDEVFAEYAHAPEARPAVTALDVIQTLTFALGGLSKLAGLPQLKLGWIVCAGPPEQRQAALARLELIADTFLSVATPVQLALPELFALARPLRAAIRARCRANLQTLERATQDTPVSLLRCDGGWSAVLRLPATQDDERWAHQLLGAGALVHPGYLYDFRVEAHVVVSLLTPEATLTEGIRRLVHHVVENS